MDEQEPKLTPLDAESARLFDGRRVSDAVVQTKCGSCGAWYETARGSADILDTFVCDCGSPMSVYAPALVVRNPTLIPPADNLALIEAGDGDARLDTGMTVKEAIARAERWWDGTGAKLMRRERQRGKGREFVSSMSPDDPNGLPSAVLNGRPWDTLRKSEKLHVVKAWHHFYVRVPDVLGYPEETFTPQRRDEIN